ncbi:MAG: phosphodiesterase [Archangium gephyra]|uniref:Phosphodiesterase n=1 Tax=Archangium gephyra TaxID=48 RepID=A0A2W5T9D8_9BACT|nr:MAG: phosphodiesterase [Archangium gephyra]
MADSPSRTPRPAWAQNLELPRSLALGALLVGVSVIAALLLSPGLSGQRIPELTQEDVGRPFRASSLAGFKASRDFEVADDAQTQRRRDEARARVRPVFDYDSQVESKVKRGVREAFNAMQEIAAPYAGRFETPRKAGTPVSKEELELLTALREGRKTFEGTAVLPDEEDFEVLAQGHFAPELEQAVMSLIELAYRGKLVSSRDEVARVDTNGVTVRIVGGTTEYELSTAAPAVFDLREAGAELDRFASVPGNLLQDAPTPVRRAVLRFARKQLRPNLTINIAETEARRKAAWEAVKPALITIKKGQRIIGDGELVTETHVLVTRSLRAQANELDLLQLQLGGAGIVALLIAGAWLFFSAALRQFRPSRRDAAFMGLLAAVLLGGLHLWVLIADAVHDRYPAIPIEALHFAFPVAAGAMLVRFVLSESSALFFAIIFSSLAGILLGNSLSFFLFALVASMVAADRISRAKDRAGIFRAGLWTGGISFGLVVFSQLAAAKGLGVETLIAGLFAFVAAAFVLPALVLALTPLAEGVFGYASDVKLLELANLNHPALKELVLNAPGTYHHSIVMGSLVESAAEAIGANPLLARSCAYYHDIGKGRNPAFFGENQKAENPHDKLAASMSAVIIKRHVTEGLEMAREYKLPQRVADAIPEHHGTRLVGYFFHKAQKELEGREDGKPIDETMFRYPGPKPRSRETALVMIADACEAASRSMPEPSTDKLRALVQKMINLIFSEGQLDECDLTLKDLHLIAESFTRTLEGMYHARPQYPAGAVGGGKPPEREVVKSLSIVK